MRVAAQLFPCPERASKHSRDCIPAHPRWEGEETALNAAFRLLGERHNLCEKNTRGTKEGNPTCGAEYLSGTERGTYLPQVGVFFCCFVLFSRGLANKPSGIGFLCAHLFRLCGSSLRNWKDLGRAEKAGTGPSCGKPGRHNGTAVFFRFQEVAARPFSTAEQRVRLLGPLPRRSDVLKSRILRSRNQFALGLDELEGRKVSCVGGEAIINR